MRLDIARQRRPARAGEGPTYVVTAKLELSGGERNDLNSLGLADYEIDLDEEDEDAEVIPVQELIAGRELEFGNAHEAAEYEELLLAACSEFAQLLIDSRDFGGRDQYELPLEELDEDEDEDNEDD
jgi:hypothetical protein